MIASNKEKLMKGVVFKLNLKGKIEFGHTVVAGSCLPQGILRVEAINIGHGQMKESHESPPENETP